MSVLFIFNRALIENSAKLYCMEMLNTILNHRLWHKHAQKGALGLAVLCLLGVVGWISWSAHSQLKIKQINYKPQKIAAQSQTKRPSYRIQDIVAANLFGNPSPEVVVKKAPKTTLNLKLQGILSASDQSLARAIIQSGKKSSELYSVGEKIKNAGASIKEIRDNEVLLDRNGAIESLPLVKKVASGDRKIISYSDAVAIDTQNVASVTPASTAVRNNRRSNATRPQSANGEPRKIRKPNFSGLDKALRKMGEL